MTNKDKLVWLLTAFIIISLIVLWYAINQFTTAIPLWEKRSKEWPVVVERYNTKVVEKEVDICKDNWLNAEAIKI